MNNTLDKIRYGLGVIAPLTIPFRASMSSALIMHGFHLFSQQIFTEHIVCTRHRK